MRIRLSCLLALALMIGVAPAFSQDRTLRPDVRITPRQDSAPPASAENDPQGVLKLLPSDAVNERQMAIGGRPFGYVATAGTIPLHNQNGSQVAAVFYTAYVAKGAAPANRPVTFVFNGGPGAASVYLHLGLVGPRIVDFGPDGRGGATPKLRDNPESWLEFTDLVIIDPVGTGWSRPNRPDGGAAFRGVTTDAASIAKVISLYVAYNSRTASPKYLLGESYGGFRAAKVASALKSDHGIIVSGIVMVSPMLETSFQWGSERDPFRAALVFPTFVATELDRTKKYTPEAMAEAERFALRDYLPTLAGPPLTGKEAQDFYAQVARLTGVPIDMIARSGGYVSSSYLSNLRGQGAQVSIYDGSMIFFEPYAGSVYAGSGGDPLLDGFLRSLSSAFVGYARDELGYKTDMTYTQLNREGGWDWRSAGDRPGASGDLRSMLSLEPSFRLLVSHGRSDFVTPYGISRYLLDQIKPPTSPERVQLRTYHGGHMFYLHDGERRAFTAEAKLFYQGTRQN